MSTPVLADTGSGVINLDQPGTYLHWSIFTVSVANLVLIAVMVIIFAVALLLPFPRARTYHRPSCVLCQGKEPRRVTVTRARRLDRCPVCRPPLPPPARARA